MKTAIIFSGTTGTCEIVAKLIDKGIKHSCDIFDTSKTFYIDFDEYDNFILGTNVRFGNLNKRFKRLFKKMKQYTTDKQNYYVYICGADINRAEDYISEAREIIDVTCDYYFVGGEVKLENTKGFFNKMILKSYMKTYNKTHDENPSIIYENIDKLVESINDMEKNKEDEKS